MPAFRRNKYGNPHTKRMRLINDYWSHSSLMGATPQRVSSPPWELKESETLLSGKISDFFDPASITDTIFMLCAIATVANSAIVKILPLIQTSVACEELLRMMDMLLFQRPIKAKDA